MWKLVQLQRPRLLIPETDMTTSVSVRPVRTTGDTCDRLRDSKEKVICCYFNAIHLLIHKYKSVHFSWIQH